MSIFSERPKRGIDLVDSALVKRVSQPADGLFISAELHRQRDIRNFGREHRVPLAAVRASERHQ